MAVYHHSISVHISPPASPPARTASLRKTRACAEKLFHHFMAAFHILVDMPPALCENSDSRPISFLSILESLGGRR